MGWLLEMIFRKLLLRSTYTYTVEPPFVCIVDHDKGRSVTNDVENVIADLVAAGIDVDAHILIYRDTSGTWDRVITGAGQFVTFGALNARSKEEAKSTACWLRKRPPSDE